MNKAVGAEAVVTHTHLEGYLIACSFEAIGTHAHRLLERLELAIPAIPNDIVGRMYTKDATRELSLCGTYNREKCERDEELNLDFHGSLSRL